MLDGEQLNLSILGEQHQSSLKLHHQLNQNLIVKQVNYLTYILLILLPFYDNRKPVTIQIDISKAWL